MYSHRDLLLHSICDILPQNTLMPFPKSAISSVLTPPGALRNFRFFCPFREYLGGARFTGFSSRQCRVETLVGFEYHSLSSMYKVFTNPPVWQKLGI